MRNPSIFKLLCLFFCAFTVTSISGANYYLVFDPACMDRLEYSYEETRPGNEFVFYSVTIGTGEKVLLEVGLETRAPIKTLNTDVLTNCDKAKDIFNSSLTEKVNNKVDQIYIVTPVNMGQEYRVAAVNSASYYSYDGQIMLANNQQYRFEYNQAANNNGDLSNGDARGNVYYIENLPLGPCEVVALRQTYGRENNHLDIYVVPEIGVVEEKSSLANTSFRLTKVNNTPFADYVYRVCGQTNNNFTQNQQEDIPTEFDFQAKNGEIVERLPVEQPAVMHQVVKGETLFGISKKYDASVADIKVWNNLSTDIIYVGDQLMVSPPNTPQEFNQQQDFTTKGVSEYGATDLFQNPSPNGQPAWTQTGGRHVVQQGETVLSIARMYGFTEERFRFFNNLTPTARVREGDILVTDDCDINNTLQSKGVNNYSTIPNGNAGQQNQPSRYEYNNSQNPAYKDQFNDFDKNYPDEFQNIPQNQGQQGQQQQPTDYNFPPGFTPKSPTGNINNSANDNFYSPSNYGPVPGTYNNNAPLREPSNYNYSPRSNDPTDYNTYLNTQNPQNQQQRSAVPQQRKAPGTSASPPYGGIPNNYNNLPAGTVSKGLPSNYATQVPLTGIKKMHTVKEGETLTSIAARYGTTVAHLRALNQMEKNEVVIPFQQIYVQK